MSTPVVRVELKRADAVDVLSSDAELKDVPVVRALLAYPEALRSAVLRRFAPQTVLWQQGDEGDSLLLVTAGAARVLARRDTDNAELTTARKGDVLGESEALGGAKRGYSVAVQQQLDVVEVPRAALLNRNELPRELASLLQSVKAQRAKALNDLSDFLNRW